MLIKQVSEYIGIGLIAYGIRLCVAFNNPWYYTIVWWFCVSRTWYWVLNDCKTWYLNSIGMV